MMDHRHASTSTVRGDDAESARTPFSVMAGELKVLNLPEPLPPKKLKRYTTTQLYKGHVQSWLVFSILAIVGTILAASLFEAGGSSSQTDCNIDSNASETEQLFRINLVLLQGLSFARAKFIDLLWDTVIGQGGRFVHGLVLHQLASRALTLILERKAVPYSFFLGVKFSTVSIESLWVCCQAFYSAAPTSTLYIVIGLLLAISYVLAFAIIWSAATGYEADRVPAYDILGSGAYFPHDSDKLTACWSVRDLNRVDSNLIKPITGPTFAQIYRSWDNIGGKKEFEQWTIGASDSGAFADLYRYAMAKETFFRRHNTTNFANQGIIHATESWYDDDCYKSGMETPNGYNFTEYCTSHFLYTSVDGWQYAGLEQKERESLPPDSHTNLNDSDYFPYSTTFILNTSRGIEERVVPYNSTLWWNSTPIALDAPFLDIGSDCQWSQGSLGLCICLDGNVLTEDFRNSPHICLNDTGYLWGFSGFVLLIGLALETAWLLICAMMWFIILTKSELVKMHRPGAGVIRGILDIAGAINSSLGSDTGAYAEDELKRALAKCPPVGFDIDDRERIGYERIQLCPMRHGTRIRRKLGVNGRALYG
ncbi:hypothetical protein F5Y08DRAFT_319586 [Xylaria arbuscula]|nr:hypothetical protein F5Y08DRAFT_319586 [Xylaria arbuscula]